MSDVEKYILERVFEGALVGLALVLVGWMFGVVPLILRRGLRR